VINGSLTLNSSTGTNCVTDDHGTTDGTVLTAGGTTLTLVGSSILGGIVTNDGTIDTSGTSAINASMTNCGTIEALCGKLTLTGSVTGTGTMKIDAGATLELGLDSAEDITFEGAGAKLIIDGTFANNQISYSFTGHIHSLDVGDSIDLT